MKSMFVGPSTEFKLEDMIEFARTVKTHYFVPFAVIVPPAVRMDTSRASMTARTRWRMPSSTQHTETASRRDTSPAVRTDTTRASWTSLR